MKKVIASYKIDGVENSSLNELIEYLNKTYTFSVDTETCPDRNMITGQRVTMLQIGDVWNQFAIDVRTIDITPLKVFFESRKWKKVLHNAKFDYQVIKESFGWTTENVWDTMLGEYIRYTGLTQKKGFYSLEETLARYTDARPYGNQLNLFNPWIPKSARTEIGKLDKFDLPAISYGMKDIEVTYEVFLYQHKYLAEQELLKVAHLENKFVLVLADIELAGMPINVDRWIELEEWAKEKADALLNELRIQHPEVENWNSHVQVKKLFKSLGISVYYQGKESIQEIVVKGQANKFPIIDLYLKYKGMSKLVSTYGISFLKHLNPVTDRIHTSFIQILNTGRTL